MWKMSVEKQILEESWKDRGYRLNGNRIQRRCNLSWIIDRVRNAILEHEKEVTALLQDGRTIAAYEEINRIAAKEDLSLAWKYC